MSEQLIKNQPLHFRPCKPGYFVKVYLSHEYGESEYTTGVVTGLDEKQRPIIFYRDLTHFKLRDYQRCILFKDVVMSGKYIVHTAWPKPKVDLPSIEEDLTQEEELELIEIRTFNGLRL